MKKVLSILAAAFIAVMFTSCGGGANTPDKVADKFLKSMGKGDFAEAQKLATGDAAEMVKTLASMAELGGKQEAKAEPKIEEMKCTEEGETANCKYKQDGKEGSIDLKKVDGKWLVSKFPKESGSGDQTMEEETTPKDSAKTDDVVEEKK